MTNEDASYNDLPTEYKYPSYASAAANSTKSNNTQFSSPTASEYTEWQTEKQQLQQQISDQANLIEKIQADLQTKINRSKDLEDQLAQAIELAHSRDARIEEMMLRFEQLMRTHQQNPDNSGNTLGPRNGNDDEDQPVTPERLQNTGPPPTKKPNHNASPHRNIFPIFRQQHGRMTSSPKGRKQSSSLLTQPMKTDDVSRQPSLGAKPSGKMVK